MPGPASKYHILPNPDPTYTYMYTLNCEFYNINFWFPVQLWNFITIKLLLDALAFIRIISFHGDGVGIY